MEDFMIEPHADPPEDNDLLAHILSWLIVRGVALLLAGSLLWGLIFIAKGCWRAISE